MLDVFFLNFFSKILLDMARFCIMQIMAGDSFAVMMTNKTQILYLPVIRHFLYKRHEMHLRVLSS